MTVDSSAPQRHWAEDDSTVFMAYGPAFTPARERQHEIILQLVASVRPTQVVELCCGAGDLARQVLDRLPDCRLLAFDGSRRMLDEIHKSCTAHHGRLELRQFELAERGWRRLAPAPDAIYSSLAIHHLDGAGKRQLFGDLFAALAAGGLFVLADLMLPTMEVGYRIAGDDWQSAVATRSQELFGDDRALRAFEAHRWNFFRSPQADTIDQPSSLFEHFGWLAEAGFQQIDLHWMMAGQAILSARKPGRRP